MTITTVLERYRREMDLTQAELAERADTTQQSVSQWESRKRVPTLGSLKRLATVLGCTLDELAGDYEEGKR